jgi:hypothetical protein
MSVRPAGHSLGRGHHEGITYVSKAVKITLGVVGAFVALIVIVGVSGGGTAPAPAPAMTYSAPAPVVTQAPAVVQAPPVVQAPAETGPLTTFGNGTYVVGEDVKAGKYRSPAPQEGAISMCYFDVRNDAGDIVDQGVANEGPSRVTLRNGTTFKSSGCEDWSPAK